LPEEDRDFARRLGLAMALFGRLIMLFFIAWILSLSEPLFELIGHTVSTKDLILIGGGLFLLGKSTSEIHDNLEGPETSHGESFMTPDGLTGVLLQILLLDVVFSIDSVLTGIGLVDEISIIVIAMCVAMGVMILSVNVIGQFIEEHPSFKMLALAFLIMVGTVLISDGMGFHIPRGYIYFAMAFSAGVQFLNLRMRKRKEKSLHLRKQPEPQDT
ncbi:MAG: TerC family protein, partial [bacterium]